MSELKYPLQYPIGWSRTARPERSAFDRENKRTILAAWAELEKQVELLGGRSIIISTNVPVTQKGSPYSRYPEPKDPGIACYFKLKGVDSVIACDAWDRVKDNLWAAAKDTEALRGRLRWKARTAEQLFEELRYLPPPGQTADKPETPLNWWDVLQVPIDAELTDIERSYRSLAAYYHPDRPTGNEKMMALLNKAIAEARTNRRARVGTTGR